jgi:hypothetical protein
MDPAPDPAVLLPPDAPGRTLLAKFFRALGDPTRLRLLELLLQEEKSVSECVAEVGLAQSRVSTHLGCLADCGFVQARREGRYAYYRVADPRWPSSSCSRGRCPPTTTPPWRSAPASTGRPPEGRPPGTASAVAARDGSPGQPAPPPYP